MTEDLGPIFRTISDTWKPQFSKLGLSNSSSSVDHKRGMGPAHRSDEAHRRALHVKASMQGQFSTGATRITYTVCSPKCCRQHALVLVWGMCCIQCMGVGLRPTGWMIELQLVGCIFDTPALNFNEMVGS